MSLFDAQQKVCLAICTPLPMRRVGDRLVHETISPLWHRARSALSMPSNINTFEVFADGMEVGEARSMVAAQCLAHEPPPTYLFFLDYDVEPSPDAVAKLFFRASTLPDYDIYAGVYCLKRPGCPEPLVYGDNGQGPIWDWTVGDLLTTESHGVKSVHMGLTLIRVSLFQRLKDAGLVHGDGTGLDDEPFFKTIHEEREVKNGRSTLRMGTEDIYFCDKVAKLGGKILVDTSVLAAHRDKNTGVAYGLPTGFGPAKRAKWMTGADHEEADENSLKLALDIGAGGTRREWPGHKTYTTDIRADTKPDYVQDTRKLNLPSDHFDLVASSHHLEHIGRWEQETVWREMFRVCKPGGAIEHIVPNVEWAAKKIADGCIDEHVLNVLYGSQESHGYKREFNTHFFGYTPTVGRALAEAVGFVDVSTESWLDNESLGYNLILRGKKPVAVEELSQPAEDVSDERLLAALCAD